MPDPLLLSFVSPPLRAWMGLREVLARLPVGGAPPALPRLAPAARRGHRWSREEERRAAAAYQSGDEAGEIALALARSPESVRVRLRRLGVLA